MPLLADRPIQRVAFVGTYPPRHCGIATFTADLCDALAAGGITPLAVPVNDTPEGYAYSPPVRFTIDQNDPASYRRAAQFLNINRVDVVNVQHEYGIFGGAAGSHIVAFLRELRTPVVSTLHTVLRDPTREQRLVLRQLATLSDRMVVMSQRGQQLLREYYDVPAEKIDLLPHGIPDVPFVAPNFYKDQFGVAGKHVLLTFGLLSPGKGIEHAITALPAIRQQCAETVYMVVGTTHPHVRRAQGESYRLSLRRLARDLNVGDAVIFHDRFVDARELSEFVGAADIYVTPYLHEAQIASGTLALAVGSGKALISTPYWYAQELLADGRGVLVPFRDPAAIAQAAIGLLANEA
ncbi:MAG: glycosyltransferase family 4 protein, partial [Dongiaceae bacterium]